MGPGSGGEPNHDPAAANAGTLTPLGGAKGYALALIIDVICSCAAGGNDSRKIPRMFENPTEPSGVGYFMGAIDISKFCDIALFKARTDTMYDELKNGRTAPGFQEIMLPGEIEYRLMRENEKRGIEISGAVLEEFRVLAEKYQVSCRILQPC